MKRIVSLIMSVIIMFGISSKTFAAYTENRARAYEAGDCTVTYTIQNEWDGNRQISMTVTNNGSKTLRNWALKFDNSGEIADIWNASVVLNTDGLCVIKNNGYNYEIIPDGSVELGFQLRGDELALPESVAMCNKTVDSTESAEISYEIRDNWDDGFIAEVSVTNNSDIPLEAWRLAFGGNFEISNIWNVNRLYTENGFLVENNVATVPIASGETKSFGFQGVIASGETPKLSDFILTSIVVDLDSELPVNPDKPDDPDPENPEHIIMCFGEYIEEEKSLEVYWYSTDEGEVSLYENTDNSGWTTLTENVNGDSYKYEIGEDFLVKQIKAVQETENGTLETEPFIVALTEDGYVCTWLDSDNDGLPDYVEKAYGTDPNNPDTDGDGLTDYEEIYKTGTNPLKYDTDENGVNDADDDNDGDGLSNKNELELGTSPNSADTDNDGLSDYDEINKYNTDPLKADSDEDTLSDGDEIAIRLDPNDPETFGVPDSEYKVEQTISADSEAMSRVNTEEAPYELSLEISASGNAAKHLIAGSSIYSNITDSEARLGGAVGLNYFGGEVDKVKLIYEINDEYILNEGSEYAEKCLDLQGIKRYNIFRYFEDLNMLLPVETKFDEESNTLYAETDRLGTYCVMDMEILMQNLGIDSNGLQTETVRRQTFSSSSIDVSGTTTENYSVTFIFDVRKGIVTANQLDNMKQAVRDFAAEVEEKGRNVTIRLISQDGNDFFNTSYKVYDRIRTFDELDNALNNIKISKKDFPLGNNCSITDALNYVINAEGIYYNNYVFDMYSQTNTVYNNSYVKRLYSDAQKKKINISIISDSQDVYSGYQGALARSTGGLILNDYKIIDGSLIFNHIFGAKFSAILLTGYEPVQLNAQLNSINNMDSDYVDCAEDDDLHTNDHLTDWEEVGVDHWAEVGLMSVDESGNAVLPTIMDCLEFTELAYVEEGLKRFEQELGANFGAAICGKRVLPVISDPTRADSDGDGIVDRYDPNPLMAVDVDTPCLYDKGGIFGVENHNMGLVAINDELYYMCKNCNNYCVLAPEEEDRKLLSPAEIVLTYNLLTIRTLYLTSGDLYLVECINLIIDQIRSGHSYQYCDSSYKYTSPTKYAYATDREKNDLVIELNVDEHYRTDKLHQAYATLGLEILKLGRAIIDYSLIAKGANLFYSVSWSICSELIFSTIENRDVDYSSMLFSIICSLTDDLFTYHIDGYESCSVFSSYAFANSYLGGIASQLAISERIDKSNLQQTVEPTLRYAISLKIHSSKKSHYFYYDYAFDLSEKDMPIIESIEREDDSGNPGNFKNTLFVEIEEIDGAYPTKYTIGIIGDYYCEKNRISDIYEWKGADGKVVQIQ